MLELQLDLSTVYVKENHEVFFDLDTLKEFVNVKEIHGVQFVADDDFNTLQENAPNYFLQKGHGYIQNYQFPIILEASIYEEDRVKQVAIHTACDITVDFNVTVSAFISRLEELSTENITCAFPYTQDDLLEKLNTKLRNLNNTLLEAV